jgi:hypothetical protein
VFQRLLGGLPLGPWLLLAWLALSTLTLLFSMIVASRLHGGIDFGSPAQIVPRAAALLAATTALNLVECGLFLAGPVWFFGLMWLFRLDWASTSRLARVNWGMTFVWKLLLTLVLMT